MELFEATFRVGYEYFERVYDTDLKKSVQRKVTTPAEWYEENSKGLYSAILDDNVKLEKRQGRAKDGRSHHGFLDPMYRNIRDKYWGQDKYNMEPRIWYLDIETRVGTCSSGFPVPEKALEPISMFQIFDTKTNVMFVLGVRDWKHEADYEFDYQVKYLNCHNEIQLIETFLDLFARLDPLIIHAWNGAGFDYPYIYNRMKKLGMDVNRLSNYGEVQYKEEVIMGKTKFTVKSDGHFFVDLMVVYQKFVFKKPPSYSLDTIASIVLKKNKVQHTEYAAFDDFYTGKYIIPRRPTEAQKSSRIYQEAVKGNWEEVKELAHSEFVYYGIIDTKLPEEIDGKKNLTSIMIMISEKMGVQISDSMGTVKPWSQYISNRSQQNKQIMPPRTDNDKPDVVGGYVRDPVLGKLKWVLSGDVNSMYPLLGMCGFNMSPETYVPKYKLPDELRDIVLANFNDQDESTLLDLPENVWNRTTELLQEHDLCLGINGAVFEKNKLGMIPELVTGIYGSRKIAKETQIKHEKRKIMIQEILRSRVDG